MQHISELNECPHCNHDEWYQKESYKGIANIHARFDGEGTDNSEMYDYAEHTLKSKFGYCSNCHKKIALLDEQ